MNDEIIAIISDPHLTSEFDREKCDIIRAVIEGCDKLVINGDFIEEYMMTFDEFLSSPWSELFPLMLSKNAVCVIGNHDTVLPNQAYQNFCTSVVERLELDSGGVKFVIMHGHRFDDRIAVPSRMPSWVRRILSTMAKRGCKMTGWRSLVIYKPFNWLIKRWKKRHMAKEEWLITGHTHWGEVDRKARYANSGLFLSPKIFSYLLIKGGKISMRRWI